MTGGLDEATVTGYRVCVRPMPADGQSIVGWLPGVPGVYVAVTHSGVTLGAHLAGLITADLSAARPRRNSPRSGPGASPWPSPCPAPWSGTTVWHRGLGTGRWHWAWRSRRR